MTAEDRVDSVAKADSAPTPRWNGLLVLACLLTIGFVIPAPDGLTPTGWRLTAIFVTTIAGLIAQPIPGGAVVFVGILLACLVGGVSIEQALSGYSDSTVWLVLSAFFISTAIVKTGLAKRIALLFVAVAGGTAIGVVYALALTDLVLASIIPSNAARSGGVTLPIARSIAELFGSKPGPTAHHLGSYLVSAVYQTICISAAMFITGHAGNPLFADLARSAFGYSLNWLNWFMAAMVPGTLSLLIVPWVVFRLNPPAISRTPEAKELAKRELYAMGSMDRSQVIVLVIFIAVCALWIMSTVTKLDIAIPALIGVGALLVSGVLLWKDITENALAWDMFVWYGGIIVLGRSLYETGVTRVFAELVGTYLSFPPLYALLAGVVIYVYAHYGFASITAHTLAMFLPFATVLITKGIPIGLVVLVFAFCSTLAAGLTHYGTTPAPMYYATGYVDVRMWWKIGVIVSLVNLAVWLSVGPVWWRMVGVL